MFRKISIAGWTASIICLISSISLAGCGKEQAENQAADAQPPMPVNVVEVKQATVPVYLDYVGTSHAKKSVDLVARVKGFLIERKFEEGSFVKKGDLLYVIDPAQYEAVLHQSEGELAQNQASLGFAWQEVKRYRDLAEKEYVTRELFNSYVTKARETEAAVKASQAKVKQAKLDLGYTNVYAPLDGKIGDTLVHVGNLVGPEDNFKLATIVQMTPIHVYFNPSSEQLVQLMKQQQKEPLTVTLRHADGTPYPHKGKVDFVNNKVNPTTSTIALRAVVPNPEGTLFPGQYTQVEVLLGEQPNTLLAPTKAVNEGQGGKFVYVVGKENKVQSRAIKTGSSYGDWKEIKEGVNAGEKVLTSNLQMVRPGVAVKPTVSQVGLTAFNDDTKAVSKE